VSRRSDHVVPVRSRGSLEDVRSWVTEALPPLAHPINRKPAMFYPYLSETWELLFVVLRFDPKAFAQARLKGAGTEWEWRLGAAGERGAARRVPYALPWVLAWLADSADRRTLAIPEGEKCVEAIIAAGGIATCNPGGAGKWHNDYGSLLAGAHPAVAIVADQDRVPKTGGPPRGLDHAFQVRDSLARAGVAATIVRPPIGKDAADALAAGCTLDELYAELDPLAEVFDSASTASLAASNGSPAFAWEEPVPLRPGRSGPLPRFPIDALPAWQAEWAGAIAAEKGTNVDLPACLVLGLNAGALQRHVVVCPRPGYFESTSLYVIPAVPPGQGKTPVFKAAVYPVRTIELELATAWDQEQPEWKAAEELGEKRRRALAAKLSSEEGPVEAFAAELAELAPTPPPPRPRLMTADVTPEKLAELLGAHGRIVAASDEGAALFENLAGRYTSGSSSWDVFNQGHSGGPLRIDRSGFSEPITVDDAALTLVIATQPVVVLDLYGKTGAIDRGVLARPLFALPAPAWPTLATPEAPASIVNTYTVNMRRLWRRVPGLRLNEHELPDPVRLTFSPAARTIFEEWELTLRAHVRTRVEEGDMSAAVGWLAKLAGQTARIAACLHTAEHWTAGEPDPLRHELELEVDGETVTRAIAIARYFLEHAAALFGLAVESVPLRRSGAVLAWIARRPEPAAPFSTRDVHRALGRAGVKRDEFDRALTALAGHGYIRRIELARVQGASGRPLTSPRWEPHPGISELLEQPAHTLTLYTPADDSDIPTKRVAATLFDGFSSDVDSIPSADRRELGGGRKPHNQAKSGGSVGMSELSAKPDKKGAYWEPTGE
jgi:uncharacterized protein DUF3987